MLVCKSPIHIWECDTHARMLTHTQERTCAHAYKHTHYKCPTTWMQINVCHGYLICACVCLYMPSHVRMQVHVPALPSVGFNNLMIYALHAAVFKWDLREFTVICPHFPFFVLRQKRTQTHTRAHTSTHSHTMYPYNFQLKGQGQKMNVCRFYIMKQ